MKRYYKSALALVAFALTVPACTSVDDTLGQSYVPPQQDLTLLFKTLKGSEGNPFSARLAVNDSVAASSVGVIYIGQKSDALGKTRAAAMTDFYPSTTTFNDSKYFGRLPHADSIFIDIMINDIVGDASKEQTFNIYSMTDSLKRDSVYYMHTPGRNPNYPDRTQKTLEELKGDHLFTFKLSDKIPVGALALQKLEVTDKGNEFLQRLTTVSDEVCATPWPEFHKMFNGLYIEPAPGSPEDAALYELELRSSYSGFYVWYHNHDENYNTSMSPAEEAQHHLDTAYVTYDFSDTNWYSDSRVVNVNINNITNEYPAAVQTAVASGSVVSVGYVQSLGGLGTKLTATPELMAWLETLKKADGTPRAVISRALLTVPLAGDASVADMNAAPTRLGMYYWFGAGTNIPDYDYAYEVSSSSSSAFMPYGGYLQRSNKNYTMNITMWLTQLLLDPTVAEKEIWLGPQITTRSTQFNQVALDAKMTLDVAYTLTE